jgi:hypothetical protein
MRTGVQAVENALNTVDSVRFTLRIED